MHPVITVQERSGLLRAYTLMLQNNLLDILVVSEDGNLLEWRRAWTLALQYVQPGQNLRTQLRWLVKSLGLGLVF
jgi:hypothetical protein